MKKEQLVIVGIILVVGLGLFLFGRTSSGPGPDAMARTQEALKAHQVPVLAVVAARSAEGRAYLEGLKRLIAEGEASRVQLVVADLDNPNEREGAQGMLGPNKPPLLLVIGLNGVHTYAAPGQYDEAAVKKAIATGLSKPPMKIEEEGPDEHGHGSE